MQEESYYQEIENYIKRRMLEENYDTLNNYWNIGKLLVEAQGGFSRAKYGNKLIKKWSIEFTKNYGKGYDYSNLSRFRQLYINFPNFGTLSQLSWSIVCKLLPIKDENKRNYYLNKVINNNLSVRQLREAIKSNSYERLINKPEHIELNSYVVVELKTRKLKVEDKAQVESYMKLVDDNVKVTS